MDSSRKIHNLNAALNVNTGFVYKERKSQTTLQIGGNTVNKKRSRKTGSLEIKSKAPRKRIRVSQYRTRVIR